MRQGWVGMVVAALLWLPAAAQAWWNQDWPYRAKVEVAPSIMPAQVVPVRLHAGNFAFDQARPDGSDLRFVGGDDKTPLNFHFERYDSTEQIAIAWVRLPASADPAAPSFWLYHGNQNAPAVANAPSSYDTGYTTVLHFAEKDGLPLDAVTNGPQPSRFSAKLGAEGVVDGGARFAPTDNLVLADTPHVGPSDKLSFSFSAWLKLGDATAPALILSRAKDQRAFQLGVANGKLHVQLDDGKNRSRAETAENLAVGAWMLVALSWSDKLVVYVDGKPLLTLAAPTMNGDSGDWGDWVVGAHPGLGDGFAGALDELQLATVAWPAAVIYSQFVAQDPVLEGTSLAKGEEASGSSFYSNMLLMLARSVSTDGWVIVGIIGVLGFVSFEVMVSKMLLLRQIQISNTRFLGQYRKLGHAAAASADTASAKSVLGLSALYQGGLEEFRRQCETAIADGGSALSPAQFEVIRASIETTLVNESHRMNRSLVLLTLAVSAAPFLGLLGTVVGIMICFGSIAASGDVNVTTLAPGVAAALMCTVAGLVVAIPVMFGYNFLASKVRELTLAMEVFANELVGRFAVARIAN